MSETLYLETDFLQFDIEEITYDEYDVKIENAEIFIDFIEIKKFLEKYLGGEYDIGLFREFWNWQNESEYDKEDRIEICEGKVEYPCLYFDNYTIKDFMEYVYDDNNICNDKYNIYAMSGIYAIIDDILREIVFNTVRILEKKIIKNNYKKILNSKSNWYNRYKVRISPKELGIDALLEKCSNYRKKANDVLEAVKANLNNFLQSEIFSELIQDYLSEEMISINEFVKEIKLQLDFWDNFYDKFFKECSNSKKFPELSKIRSFDEFIIPKIHNIAVEKVKSRLEPFLI
jgi:hypothetical protein